MPWVLDTNLERPFYQVGLLSGDGLSKDDLHAKAEVARVYQTGGRSLTAAEQPSRLELTDAGDITKIPPIFGSMDGILIASPVGHAALTELAPSSLQTWPLELSHNHQSLTVDSWYGLNIHRCVESIDLERSAVKQSRGFDGVMRPSLKLRKKQVALRAGADESLHIWRDQTFPHVILISDEMKSRLDACGALAAVTCFETSG